MRASVKQAETGEIHHIANPRIQRDRSWQVKTTGHALNLSVCTFTSLFGEASWHLVSLATARASDHRGLSDR